MLQHQTVKMERVEHINQLTKWVSMFYHYADFLFLFLRQK